MTRSLTLSAARACEVGDANIVTLNEPGFSEEDALDISAIAAFFGMSNRLANVTSMRPNDEFYNLGR
ncbi:hypothetical protein MCELHM10_04147 [Paracoccaceae bacterium]